MHSTNTLENIVMGVTTQILNLQKQGALFIGRVWQPQKSGPTPVLIRNNHVLDISKIAATTSSLLELDNLAALLNNAKDLPIIADLSTLLNNSLYQNKNLDVAYLLAPCDIQAIKASGVTFVASMLERVIEERAAGDLNQAAFFRKELNNIIGDDLSKITPGSKESQEIKRVLQEKDAWSQYLEVGIGPDAEIFSKAQPMSSVGFGAQVGIHPISTWNNPEPEVVLAINSKGNIIGASLGNDVNLRDVEGRSALLLGKAKDNNGACSIGPFIRVFDDNFTLEDVKNTDIHLNIQGEDDFELDGLSSMSKISRSPESLVSQTIGPNHQYPDGLMLFLGTMFAPAKDRDEKGKGFTHHINDKVSISSKELPSLVNWVNYSDKIPAWNFGTWQLMKNLSHRGLL